MAYKDEYEVARLYTDGNFLKQVANELGGDNLRFEFHLAPPLLARPNPATGEPRKISFGPWMMSAFKVLARFKFLRGTPLDIFGYSEERRTERKLVADYVKLLDEIVAKLTARQPAARRRPCRHPGKDSRLRAGQGPPPRHRQGRRGGAAGPVPLRQAADVEGRGIAAPQTQRLIGAGMVNFLLTPSALNGVPSIRRQVLGGFSDALKNNCHCDRRDRRRGEPGGLRIGAAAFARRAAWVRQGDRGRHHQRAAGASHECARRPGAAATLLSRAAARRAGRSAAAGRAVAYCANWMWLARTTSPQRLISLFSMALAAAGVHWSAG